MRLPIPDSGEPRHSYGSYHLAKYRNAALRQIKWGTRMHGFSMRIIERS
jgi:hypothetical protein